MNQTSQRKINDDIYDKEIDLTNQIDETLKDIKSINADIEAKYGKYLKDDYAPVGYDSKGLKDKVDEMTDQKEQDDLLKEVDDKIAAIMSEVIDISKQE